ncbi:hypothetical protein TWF694_008257 [Orbilia ellipsospora]|uniref:F-box domain-containing protein n=1 Tax=Orbilia ellipsospora TaxID=2528407 RepID=A0AAV9XG65_9PEZI
MAEPNLTPSLCDPESLGTPYRQRCYILKLPHEIQVKVLGHLCINDQISAYTVCKLWKRLLQNGFLKHDRYLLGLDNREISGFGIHKITDGIIFISAVVDGGEMKDFRFTIETDDQNHSDESILDVSDCSFLDEALISGLPTDRVSARIISSRDRQWLDQISNEYDELEQYFFIYAHRIEEDGTKSLIAGNQFEVVFKDGRELTVREFMMDRLKAAKSSNERLIEQGTLSGLGIRCVKYQTSRHQDDNGL